MSCKTKTSPLFSHICLFMPTWYVLNLLIKFVSRSFQYTRKFTSVLSSSFGPKGDSAGRMNKRTNGRTDNGFKGVRCKMQDWVIYSHQFSIPAQLYNCAVPSSDIRWVDLYCQSLSIPFKLCLQLRQIWPMKLNISFLSFVNPTKV